MEQLLRSYYRERLAAVDSLLREADDDLSRRVYAHLKAGYERDLALLDRQAGPDQPCPAR